MAPYREKTAEVGEDEEPTLAASAMNLIAALEPLEPADRADVITAAAALLDCDLTFVRSTQQNPSPAGASPAKRKAFESIMDVFGEGEDDTVGNRLLLAAATFYGFRLEADVDEED